MVAAPLGILVGTAIAGYDYVVNELLWSSLSRHLAPLTLCFMPIVALTLTGVILSLFRVKSSSMADEVVRAYHRPDQTIDYKAAIPKLTASVATMGFGGSAWTGRREQMAGRDHYLMDAGPSESPEVVATLSWKSRDDLVGGSGGRNCRYARSRSFCS